MKKIILYFILLATTMSIISCSRGITPFEAANGKAKCGRYIK